MAKFVISLVLVCMLPWVTDAVVCASDGNGHTFRSCNYCGFANITTYVRDIPSINIQYKCLSIPLMEADGYSSRTLNKCHFETDSQPGYYRDIMLNLCNQDMCNTGCADTNGPLATTANPGVPGRATTAKHGSVAGAGLGFSTLISISLLSLFNKVYN